MLFAARAAGKLVTHCKRLGLLSAPLIAGKGANQQQVLFLPQDCYQAHVNAY